MTGSGLAVSPAVWEDPRRVLAPDGQYRFAGTAAVRGQIVTVGKGIKMPSRQVIDNREGGRQMGRSRAANETSNQITWG